MGVINRLQQILLTVALLASCFLLLGSLPEAHATTGVTIRVLTIDTNQPLKGADVRINGTAIGATNATGHVNANTLNRMSNSTVEVFFRGVRVYHHPYFNATRLNPSNPAQVTIRVNVTTMVLFARTALGNPVPNVRITLVYGSYTNTTTTGSDGRASLAFMPNTTYTISTSYRGYDVGTFTKAYGGSGLTLDLNLFSIRAIVEDLNGNPVPSATVKVWYGMRQSGNTTGFESATTDSDGVAILDKLPAGNYPLDVEYRGENVYQTTSNIALSSGQVVHRARTDLVNYRVRILDFDGTEQITGISLQAQLYRDATPYGDPVTTATGEFAFGLVKSRTYSLVVKMGDTEVFRGDVRVPDDTSVAGKFFDVFFRVDASGTRSERLVSMVGLRIQLGSFSSERTTVNGATGFQNIPAGRYSYEITRGTYVIGSGTVEINQDEQRITLRPTLWTVKLLINNDQGEGIAGAVELKSYDDVSLGVFQAGENGEVSVSGLLPILYRGVVNYKGVKVNDGFEFTLDADQKEVVVATKVYNVVFRVFDADGETALSSAQVTVSLGEISAESVTDSNGRASVKNLPIGSYNVAINYLSIDVHEETVRIDSSREIVLKAKNVVDVIVEVVDDDGVPLESGDVEIVLGVVKKSGEIENGRVTFKDIPASTYRLSARYKGVT
ncbi:MAG: carboxypeptidase regulatory-like domain-containing protein, partial [Aigarchaeota archaeon]|nr:carboxypeptidase regulatory-like domain-containing protein [Candidatus Caldarchaeales archaeon]